MAKPERIHIGQDMIPKMTTERPDDDFNVVAFLKLELRRNGAMSIMGSHMDNPLLSQQMLTEAMEALKRQAPKSGLVVPGYDSAIPQPAVRQ